MVERHIRLSQFSNIAKREPLSPTLLSTVLERPEVLQRLLHDLAMGQGVDGKGLVNLLGMACLTGNWHKPAFQAGFCPSLLRSVSLTDAELITLHHVCVSMDMRAAGSSLSSAFMIHVPIDVRETCRRACHAEALRSQPLYDVVANALRRTGYRYGYQVVHRATGYLLPVQLSIPRTGIPVALSIDGSYNCIPGTVELGLSTRLWESNLVSSGMRVVRISPSEASLCFGSDSKALDVAPRQGMMLGPGEEPILPQRPRLRNPSLAKLMRGATRAPPPRGSPGSGTTGAEHWVKERAEADTLDALLAAILAQLDEST